MPIGMTGERVALSSGEHAVLGFFFSKTYMHEFGRVSTTLPPADARDRYARLYMHMSGIHGDGWASAPTGASRQPSSQWLVYRRDTGHRGVPHTKSRFVLPAGAVVGRKDYVDICMYICKER